MAEDRDSVARAVSQWNAAELEEAIVEAGGAGGMVRTQAEWAAHPQAAAVAEGGHGLVAGGGRPGIKEEVDRAALRVQDGPADTACWTAHVTLVNDPSEMGRVVRMSPLAQPAPKTGGGWDYPKGVPAALFDALARLDRAAAGAGEIDLVAQLGEAWIKQGAANQPIRSGADLAAALGDPTYVAAKRRWRSL